jgi:hypothetical protein
MFELVIVNQFTVHDILSLIYGKQKHRKNISAPNASAHTLVHQKLRIRHALMFH